jgi:hypothetical protein
MLGGLSLGFRLLFGFEYLATCVGTVFIIDLISLGSRLNVWGGDSDDIDGIQSVGSDNVHFPC